MKYILNQEEYDELKTAKIELNAAELCNRMLGEQNDRLRQAIDREGKADDSLVKLSFPFAHSILETLKNKHKACVDYPRPSHCLTCKIIVDLQFHLDTHSSRAETSGAPDGLESIGGFGDMKAPFVTDITTVETVIEPEQIIHWCNVLDNRTLCNVNLEDLPEESLALDSDQVTCSACIVYMVREFPKPTEPTVKHVIVENMTADLPADLPDSVFICQSCNFVSTDGEQTFVMFGKRWHDRCVTRAVVSHQLENRDFNTSTFREGFMLFATAQDAKEVHPTNTEPQDGQPELLPCFDPRDAGQ